VAPGANDWLSLAVLGPHLEVAVLDGSSAPGHRSAPARPTSRQALRRSDPAALTALLHLRSPFRRAMTNQGLPGSRTPIRSRMPQKNQNGKLMVTRICAYLLYLRVYIYCIYAYF
jgi:hypothetical protein